ncbi:MAG: PAS domain S-box protein [Phycisphaerae bacterium]
MPPQSVSSTSVLVVESEQVVGKYVCRTLERLGYRVPALVARAEDALEAVARVTPELVLMEVFTEGEMDGIETAARIHSQYDLPVICMTSHTDEDTLERVKSASFYGFVPKPVSAEGLHTAIELGLHKHRLESRLRASEEKFRMYFERAPLGYQSLDAEGRVLEVNERWLTMLGYRREEVIGKSFGDFMPPASAATFPPRFERFKEQGEIRDAEVELIRNDGTCLLVSIDGRISRAPRGRFIQTHCLMRDITAQRRTQRQLQATNELLTSVFEATPVAVVVMDAEARVLRWSPMAEQIFGWNAEEILGSQVPTVPEPCWPNFRASLEQVLAGTPVTNSEVSACCRDGRQISVALSMAAVRSKGRDNSRVVAVMSDMTEHHVIEDEYRRLEDIHRQTQKFESLGMLAGGIAHDFNNLLMAILGNVDLAMTDLQGNPPLREDLEEIRRAALRASQLTNQLLAYSGRGNYLRTQLDLRDVVEKTVDTHRTALPATASLHLDLCRQELPLRGDPVQLSQTLGHLIVNAIEALEGEGGSIHVRVFACELSSQDLNASASAEDARPGSYACVELADEGCGMDRATLARIFDPFFSTKFTGRGLGLAAVLGIVRAHQGALQVESSPGRGTCVRAFLPLQAEQAARPVVPIESFKGHGKALLADDEEALRRVAERLLQDLGFEVVSAVDGAEAVELFRRHRGEIVICILDLTMPRMGGRDALHEIRRIDPDTPVLLVSGYSRAEVSGHQESVPLGFLQKPYRKSDLVNALRSVLQT